MKLLIAGDFYVSNDFNSNNLVDHEVIDLFMQADYRLLNLEAPITENNPYNRIYKTGPNLRMSGGIAIPIMKQLGINAVSLANNHILDFGEKGLFDTFAELLANNINYVGAGENLEAAISTLTIEENGLRIAIVNFCENEWSIATRVNAGANPLDPIENIKQIQKAQLSHDKVICIVHGGLEYLGVPSPRVVRLYRNFVDFGADAVISHHTHTVGAFEIYKDAPIVYGLGNLLFTINSKYSSWYHGLVSELVIKNNQSIKFRFTVVSQSYKTFRLRLASDSVCSDVLHNMKNYSDIIKQSDQHEELWARMMLERKDEYLSLLSPTGIFKNRLMNSLMWRSKVFRIMMTRRHSALLLNLCRCESHAEAIQFVLKYKVNI